jgi:hypothetical protein
VANFRRKAQPGKAITGASAHKGDVERTELMNYLHAQNGTFDNRPGILIDSALAESLSGKPDERAVYEFVSMTLMIYVLPIFAVRSSRFRLMHISYF